MSDKVQTYTHFRGEILEELSHGRLIEIASDLIWESERRRQALELATAALETALLAMQYSNCDSRADTVVKDALVKMKE